MTGVLVRKRDGTQKQMDPEGEESCDDKGEERRDDAGRHLVSTSGDPDCWGHRRQEERLEHRPLQKSFEKTVALPTPRFGASRTERNKCLVLCTGGLETNTGGVVGCIPLKWDHFGTVQTPMCQGTMSWNRCILPRDLSYGTSKLAFRMVVMTWMAVFPDLVLLRISIHNETG